MRVLLHICCGPCATYPVPRLREAGHEVRGFFFNPNIHPYQEYQQRRRSVEVMAEALDLPLVVDGPYEPEGYFRAVVFREAQRCLACYSLRLERAAAVARRGKFEAFSTTLLVSPFQHHELVRAVGESVGARYGLPFLYEDFRPGFRETVTRSRELGLYRQQYCGCLFSEHERFAGGRARREKHGERS
ncbi:MAG: epoxyqueuosine reductase QueH [Syntrophomonadaceae bacterium]|nr:epoxyqueuosine reductase QueH [Syntrophomonadaceae bacterium]